MKKYLINSSLFIASLLFAAVLLVSCAKDKLMTLPSVKTIEVLKVTSSSATVNGNITGQGNGTVSESGVVYAVTPNADILKSKVLNTQGNGKFTCILKDLLPNTTYYARTFATNEVGTAYGDEFPIITSYVKVWITDANFRGALKRQFPSAFDATSDSLKVSGANIKGFNGIIDVSGQTIASLSGIEYFPALTTLICSSNQLTSLDVSKNIALTSLTCSSNLLTSLDVSKNVALTLLDCDANQLTSLDLSKNTALSTLFCANNLLTSLDIRSQTSFPDFLAIIKDYIAITPRNSGNTGLTSLKVNAAVQQNAEIKNVKANIPACIITTWSNGTQVCGNYNPATNTCQ